MCDDVPADDSLECPCCGEFFEADATNGTLECPSCGETISVDAETSCQPISQLSLFPADTPRTLQPNKRHRGWKNFFAIIIGMVGGLLLRVALVIPFSLFLSTEDGLPQDVALLLEMFTAFVAGALAGTLVLRLGWLFGMLTQLFKLLLTGFALGVWTYLVLTDPEINFNLLDPLRASAIRLLVLSIVCAVIGGAVAEKHRDKFLSFLGSTFGLMAGGFVLLLHGLFFVFQLYFLYIGGKAIFVDGHIVKGLVIVLLIGPIASYAIGAIVIGILFGVFWVLSKIYNIYAADLGLERIESM